MRIMTITEIDSNLHTIALDDYSLNIINVTRDRTGQSYYVTKSGKRIVNDRIGHISLGELVNMINRMEHNLDLTAPQEILFV